jgi:hypothetical protein
MFTLQVPVVLNIVVVIMLDTVKKVQVLERRILTSRLMKMVIGSQLVGRSQFRRWC